MLINPVQAASPVLPQETSPYFPSSRVYRNLLYLRIEDVPGAAALKINLEDLAAAGRRLNKEPVCGLVPISTPSVNWGLTPMKRD